MKTKKTRGVFLLVDWNFKTPFNCEVTKYNNRSDEHRSLKLEYSRFQTQIAVDDWMVEQTQASIMGPYHGSYLPTGILENNLASEAERRRNFSNADS